MAPSASIIVPTRHRPDYLDVALATIAPQARDLGAEVLVVDDGPDDRTREVAARHGAAYVRHATSRGPNAARNTGIDTADSDLLVLVDDDVAAPDGWLAGLLDAARADPDADAFGGPIHARLEGRPLRLCGREGAPITTLDLGPVDRDARFVWSANMAVRRRALERAGRFDPELEIYGDEEEWQHRLAAAGGRIRYVASAGLEHRRTAADARLASLTRAAFFRGRNSRRFDARKETAPPLRHEVRVLAGCAWHTARRRCENGIVMGAVAAGRIVEALRPR